jgi:predicted aminopeptidase
MLRVEYARWGQTPADLRELAMSASHLRTRERFLALYEITQESWRRFGIRVKVGHKGVERRKAFMDQRFHTLACRPTEPFTTVAQAIVHRGVRKWFRR